MGRDKIDVRSELKEISLFLESGKFSEALKHLLKLSDSLEGITPEDAKKVVRFIDFYSRKLKSLEKQIVRNIANRVKIKDSYLK